jgi:outer membrane protein assembly factor BamB
MPGFPVSVPACLAVLVLGRCGPAFADDDELPDLPPLQLDLASPGCCIVSPGGGYAATAERLASALGKATGRRPSVLPDTTAPGALPAGPVLVLGNATDSALARRLYLGAYDLTDFAWPGKGGHVLRTIRDPLGTGAHVLLLGGSDADGVREAADALVALIGERGVALGYLNEVKLGEHAEDIIGTTARLLTSDDAQWQRSGGSGSWDYMIAVARAAIGYVRTGDEAYLPVFRREMLYFIDHDVYHPSPEAPQMLHGFVNTILIAWDLVRDHPFFTPEDRRRIDEAFLHIFRSAEGPSRIAGAAEKQIVRDNHGTRSALDAYFGGRYFLRRFGLDEARNWLDIADRYFAPQLTSAKPVCDSWGHQWNASLFNTLVYALAAGKDDYVQSEAFRQAADRALIAHFRGEEPQGYLAACAFASGDTGYLSLQPDEAALVKQRSRLSGNGDEYLRAFCTGEPVRPREDLLGVAVAPVDRLWRDAIDAAGFNPGGLYVTTVTPEQSFDKASIREGWSPESFYLLLDGISGGHHSFENATCIVRFAEAGLQWLTSNESYEASVSVRNQNGVFAALNAEGPGRTHRYARLLYSGGRGAYAALGSALEGVGPLDWQRHILRKKGAWTLVIDRLLPKADGELIAERHWYVRGSVTETDGALVSQGSYGGKPLHFHLQSVGLPPEGASGTSHRIERVRALVGPDAPLTCATLLHVTGEDAGPAARVEQTPQGWRVIGQNGSAVQVTLGAKAGISVGAGDDHAAFGDVGGAPTSPNGGAQLLPLTASAPAVELPWRKASLGAKVTAVCAADGSVAAGTEDGTIARLSEAGEAAWQTKAPAGIRSLHLLGADLLVGEEEGALSRLGASGNTLWRVEIPYVPMAWPYWSEGKSRVREIDAADLDGDGQPEVLISNSDRRLYAFTGDGKQLWKASVEWGILTAMTVGSYEGKFALLGGTSRPSIHGRCIVFGGDGKVVTYLQRPDIVSWSVPSHFLDMRWSDLNGDGREEVLCALDTNCRQVLAYDAAGNVLWDADMAGAAPALALQRTAGQLRVLVASSAGYVVALDAATGKRQWACYLGEAIDLVWPGADGSLLAVCPSGRIGLVSSDGKLVGTQDLGGPITAVVRPGDDRARADRLVLGTGTGDVYLLAQMR